MPRSPLDDFQGNLTRGELDSHYQELKRRRMAELAQSPSLRGPAQQANSFPDPGQNWGQYSLHPPAGPVSEEPIYPHTMPFTTSEMPPEQIAEVMRPEEPSITEMTPEMIAEIIRKRDAYGGDYGDGGV